MVMTDKILDEILTYLEKSINNLAKEAFENLELGGIAGAESFLENQFDVRLENLLVSKSSSTHHLESAMKNKVIQKKQEMISKIANQYKN